MNSSKILRRSISTTGNPKRDEHEDETNVAGSDRIRHLEDRVSELEEQIQRLTPVAPAPPSPLSPPPPTGASVRFEPGGRTQQPETPLRLPELPDAFGERLLRWAGVLLVVLAVGFAVSTGIDRGWIGPELQLAGAAAVAGSMIAVGLRLRPRNPIWANALCSGGVLAGFATVASPLYVDQFGTTTAFGATAVIGVAGFGLGHSTSSVWVTASALFGSILAWLTIADGDVPFLATLLWIAAAVAITIVASTDRSWPLLRLVGHTVGGFAGIPFAIDASSVLEQAATLTAAALLFGSMGTVPSVEPRSGRWQQLEVQLAVCSAPWALFIVLRVLGIEGDQLAGVVALSLAAGAALFAWSLRNRISRIHLGSQLVGASATVSIGLTLLLDGPTTVLALAVQAAGLAFIARLAPSDPRVLVHALVLGAIAALFTGIALVVAWIENAPASDDLVHLATTITLAIGVRATDHRWTRTVGSIATLALVLGWFGSTLVHLPQGQALVSLAWAVIGMSVLVFGAVRGVAAVSNVGLAVILVTIAKLLTVDLQEVDALWRAALFFVIGAGALRMGLLLPSLLGRSER